MDNRPRVGLDNPHLRSRLRTHRPAVVYQRPHATSPPKSMSDVRTGISPKPQPISVSIAEPIQVPAKPTVLNTTKAPVFAISAPQTVNKRPDLPKQARSNVLKRQTVKSSSKKYRPKHRRPLMPVLMTTMAAIVFLAGIGVTINTLQTNRKAKTQVAQLAKEAEKTDVLGITDTPPSETPAPADLSGYKVDPDSPRILTIPKISVQARVQRTGITQNNNLKSPTNIFDAGWYQSSAKPGENGAVVIGAHVAGPTKAGIFNSIGSLRAGDKIKLERGDGKIFNYTITSTEVLDNDKVDIAKVLASVVPDKPGLNLITSSGRFNVTKNSYEQRVVVFATQD